MSRHGRLALVISSAGIGILWAGYVLNLAPKLLYNPSKSAPIGWYEVVPSRAIARGDRVAAYLPEQAEALAASRAYLPAGIPVIKTVWAVGGDTVCRNAGTLTVTGRRSLALLGKDRHGRPLPAWSQGCTRLGQGEVLLISDATPDSFDSRYFGPVDIGNVIGRAVYLGDQPESRVEDGEGSLGDGGYCKIKAHGANRGLLPCLHISFYGSPQDCGEPGFETNSNESCRMAWFHSLFEVDSAPSVPE
jgi:conjugative transfer signal peptidase TraF